MKAKGCIMISVVIVGTLLFLSACAATMATSPVPTVTPPASAEPDPAAWPGRWETVSSMVIGRSVSIIISDVNSYAAAITYICTQIPGDTPGACERPYHFFGRFEKGKLIFGYATLTLDEVDTRYMYLKWDGPKFPLAYFKLKKVK